MYSYVCACEFWNLVLRERDSNGYMTVHRMHLEGDKYPKYLVIILLIVSKYQILFLVSYKDIFSFTKNSLSNLYFFRNRIKQFT